MRRHALRVVGVAQLQLAGKTFQRVVDRLPVDLRRLHGDGRHRGVHEERSELGGTLLGRGEPLPSHLHCPLGIWMRVHVTTGSRWTSRPPALSRICITLGSASASLLSSCRRRRPPGEGHGVKWDLRFVLVAAYGECRVAAVNSLVPTVPHQTVGVLRGCKEPSASTPGCRPSAFHPSQVADQVIGTCWCSERREPRSHDRWSRPIRVVVQSIGLEGSGVLDWRRESNAAAARRRRRSSGGSGCWRASAPWDSDPCRCNGGMPSWRA